MSIKQQIKTLLKEAELYHSQGLLDEAMANYRHALKLVRSNSQLKDRTSLLDGISQKVRVLNKDIEKIEKAPKQPELPEKLQDLIKKIFSFASDMNEDTKALEGAVALAKFGQFKRAISEFKELLKKDSIRVVAAKNILRCYMAYSSPDEAIDQYERWLSSNIFLPKQLDRIHDFLRNILRKEGLEKTLPQRKISPDEMKTVIRPSETELLQVDEQKKTVFEIEDVEIERPEDLDINSIGITLDSGPQKGEIFEFKVRFQLGNVVSLLIPGRNKDWIKNFEAGSIITDIQYYSNIALFQGSGLVTAAKEIKIGPLRGDYCVDIQVILDL